MSFKILIFFSTFLSSYLKSFAGVNDLSQTWSLVSKSTQLESFRLTGALQFRYSFDDSEFFEEQINFLIHKPFIAGSEIGLLLTLGTRDSFSRMNEFRSGLEWIKSYKSYRGRLRIEFRDFEAFKKVAQRFRILNEYKWYRFTFSSEFNIYLNKFTDNVRGFASHRTIIGMSGFRKLPLLSLNYIHDYREFPDFKEIRHVLQFVLKF